MPIVFFSVLGVEKRMAHPNFLVLTKEMIRPVYFILAYEACGVRIIETRECEKNVHQPGRCWRESGVDPTKLTFAKLGPQAVECQAEKFIGRPSVCKADPTGRYEH